MIGPAQVIEFAGFWPWRAISLQRFDILAVDLLGPAFFSLEMLTAAAAGQHGAVRALSPQPCAPADTSALSQRAGGSASPH
jgi:hypothetical protein